MSVYQALCKSLDNGTGWGTVGSKGKPLAGICILSSTHETLPFPVCEGSDVIRLLPGSSLVRRMVPS